MKKVRLGLIALAVMVSVGGAFATKSNSHAKGTTYDVLSTNGDGTYTVQTDEGAGHCDDQDVACKVSSDATPSGGKISQSGAMILETGNFSN